MDTINGFEQQGEFDWSPLGRDWWTEAAGQLGATQRQAKFAAAKFRNCTATDAARQAGFANSSPGALKSSGYRLARSNMIVNLLALAAAESGGGPNGNVDGKEVRQILSQLARRSDPNVKIRACEAIAKLDQADRAERVARKEMSPDDIALEIMRCSPAYAPIILSDSFLRR
jgi:hypothetical protein